MLVCELPIENFKPGLKFRTLTGKVATVAQADSRAGHFDSYGKVSTNGASYDLDDHWFFFDLEGDEWQGHGGYFHSCGLELIPEKQESADAQSSPT